MKTLAIVGAGPGLGLSLAKIFGQHDFRVALIARTEEKLDAYAQELRTLHTEAAGFPADVLNPPQLEAALARVKETFGPIDMLEYSPTPSISSASNVLDTTRENAQHQFQYNVLGAITCVRAVLPGMLAKGGGILFFTTGASALVPIPALGNVGLAMAGLRNYAYSLHQALAPKGIYVGTLSIGIMITKGDPEKDPDAIAARIYEMCDTCDHVEETFPRDITQSDVNAKKLSETVRETLQA